MKMNIELPFFPGLYESDLYNSDTSYLAIKEEVEYYQHEYCDYGPGSPEDAPIYAQITEDDLDFDFDGYAKEVVAGFVDGWKEHAPEIVVSVEYTDMVSPKYYNFSTDRIFADVELREDWVEVMRAFIKDNYEWLKDRIKKDWTSYDGFCSFMENNVDEWDKMLFEEKDERYISTMLGYMMYRENSNIKWDLVYYALEDVYAGAFVYITDEGKERLAELQDQRDEDIREGRIVIPDPDQLKLPFTE